MTTLGQDTQAIFGTFAQEQQERLWKHLTQLTAREDAITQTGHAFLASSKSDAIFKDMVMGMFWAYGYWLLSTGAHTWEVQHTNKNKDNAGASKRFDNLADAVAYIFEDMGGVRCRTPE